MGPEEARDLVENGALFVDIREPDEWEASRIPGAELKPLSGINDWWPDLPTEGTVILYCRSGNRSAHAVHALVSQAGRENVLNMEGGILAWERAGLDVDGSPVA